MKIRNDFDELKALYDQGYSITEIAKTVGISRQSLCQSFSLRGWLKKQTLPKLEVKNNQS